MITGTGSGLGRYLHEKLGGFGLTRENFGELEKVTSTETIIHCAFNKKESIGQEELNDYMQDNVFLTKKLLKIPHKRFIFLSSVNVYPQSKEMHSEDEKINLNEVETIYGITKLISESLIFDESQNSLILRCPNLLGPYAKNNITQLIEDKLVTLSQDSILNLTSYEDILSFILKDSSGIYNLASSKNITFFEIAGILKKEKTTFGNFRYDVGKINNAKCGFKMTSEEVLLNFLKEVQ
jgi:nucleoside-diphosphate-sugar epimerase